MSEPFRKMKILFLENGSSGGGSFESLYQLVTHIDRRRFDPLVVFVNETSFYKRLQSEGIDVVLLRDPIYSVSARPWLRALLARLISFIDTRLSFLSFAVECIGHYSSIIMLSRMVRREHVDCIHLNDQSARDFYGVIVAWRIRIPCVSYLRSARVRCINRRKIAFLNRVVNLFIANSHFTRQYFTHLGIAQEKIITVYNAIASEPIPHFDIRSAWRIPSSARYLIGCVGNLLDGKGQEFLLQSFVHIHAQEPRAYLIIVGDGTHRKHLEVSVKRLGLTGSVLFTGYFERAIAIIAGLNVLVLPSEQETFGRTLLEAMVAGIPIVATRSGGIPEVVQHEQNGLLVAYGDTNGMSAAIIRLLHDHTLAQRLAKRGKEICKEKFALSHHMQRIEEIYTAVVSP